MTVINILYFSFQSVILFYSVSIFYKTANDVRYNRIYKLYFKITVLLPEIQPGFSLYKYFETEWTFACLDKFDIAFQ